MKLKVKYIFPTSSSGANFYMYQLPEGLGMRKVLVHGIRMQKNSQTREDIFWTFTDFHGVIKVQSPTCTIVQKFNRWCCQTRNRLWFAREGKKKPVNNPTVY